MLAVGIGGEDRLAFIVEIDGTGLGKSIIFAAFFRTNDEENAGEIPRRTAMIESFVGSARLGPRAERVVEDFVAALVVFLQIDGGHFDAVADFKAAEDDLAGPFADKLLRGGNIVNDVPFAMLGVASGGRIDGECAAHDGDEADFLGGEFLAGQVGNIVRRGVEERGEVGAEADLDDDDAIVRRVGERFAQDLNRVLLLVARGDGVLFGLLGDRREVIVVDASADGAEPDGYVGTPELVVERGDKTRGFRRAVRGSDGEEFGDAAILEDVE